MAMRINEYDQQPGESSEVYHRRIGLTWDEENSTLPRNTRRAAGGVVSIGNNVPGSIPEGYTWYGTYYNANEGPLMREDNMPVEIDGIPTGEVRVENFEVTRELEIDHESLWCPDNPESRTENSARNRRNRAVVADTLREGTVTTILRYVVDVYLPTFKKIFTYYGARSIRKREIQKNNKVRLAGFSWCATKLLKGEDPAIVELEMEHIREGTQYDVGAEEALEYYSAKLHMVAEAAHNTAVEKMHSAAEEVVDKATQEHAIRIGNGNSATKRRIKIR